MKNKVVPIIFLSLFLFGFILSQETPSPEILITEIAYDTFQDDAKNEWVELLVVSDQPIEAEQYKVGDEETIGGGEGMMRFPKSTVLQPGQVIVIAQSAVDFRAAVGVYPHFEFVESTADVPNMRPVSILAGGDIAFANGGDEVIVLNDKNKPVDRINYGDKTTYFTPSIQPVAAGYSLERVPPNCDTNSAADFRPQRNPTPFLVPNHETCPIQLEVSEATVESEPSNQISSGAISAIQGDRGSAAKVNQIVQFQGVVTAVTADKNASGITFYTAYVQDGGDGNQQTSDAIPVFFGRRRPQIKPGDFIDVSGQVTEYFGLTEIDDDNLSIKQLNQQFPLPDPILLGQNNLPSESLEGMWVTLPEAIVAGPTFETDAGCGFSVIPIGSADLPLIRHSAQDDVSMVIPVLPNDDRDCDRLPAVQRGDRVTGLMGPLTWNFEQWKIIQAEGVQIEVESGDALPLPKPVELKGDQFSLATLNLENHFDSIDDTRDDAEPKPTQAEIELREKKFQRLITHWLGCPTLLGVQEVEKAVLLDQLAQTLETACQFRYGVAHLESYDARGIDNALLYDPRRVTVQEVQLRQTCSRINTRIDPQGFDCPRGQEPLFSRPPLEVVLTVDEIELTVFVNHFKSKRGGERETAPRRLAQAEFLLGLVEEKINASPSPVTVIGDFNDFDQSPTQKKLIEGGTLENLLLRLPAEEQYTFNFAGAGQLIDGLFVTADLGSLVAGVQILHLNADYPDQFQMDLTTENIDFKSTDHDPAIAVFNLPSKSDDFEEISREKRAEPENDATIPQELKTIEDRAPLLYKWRFVLLPLAILILFSLVTWWFKK